MSAVDQDPAALRPGLDERQAVVQMGREGSVVASKVDHPASRTNRQKHHCSGNNNQSVRSLSVSDGLRHFFAIDTRCTLSDGKQSIIGLVGTVDMWQSGAAFCGCLRWVARATVSGPREERCNVPSTQVRVEVQYA